MPLTQTPPELVSSTTRRATASSGEDVERERLLAMFTKSIASLDSAHREHGQDRAEDLLLHDRRVLGDAAQHRGREVALALAALAADGDLPALEHLHQPLVMAPADDACVVGRALRILAEELAHRRAELAHELLLAALVHEHVVGRDAGLPAFMNLPQAMRRAATFEMSTSWSTMQGLLPPSSSVTGVRCRAAAAITTRPTRPFPV